MSARFNKVPTDSRIVRRQGGQKFLRAMLIPLAALPVAVTVTSAQASSRGPGTFTHVEAAKRVTKCRTFKVKKVRHGKLVRRHGRVVLVRRKLCKTVPSHNCTVSWAKEKKHGRVVIKNHNPVYRAKVKCPHAGAPGPSPPPPQTSSPPLTEQDQLANKVLALPQHAPADIDLFPSKFLFSNVELALSTEGSYPLGSAMAPAAGPQLSDSDTRSALQQFLVEQLGTDQTKIDQALGVYDDTSVKTLIPDPTLRAAFAGLTGTSLEPAMNYFRDNGAFFSLTPPLAFGSVDSLTAISEQRHSGGHGQVVINSRYQNEPFQLIVALIGHELQHSQATVTAADEAITNFELGVEYVEILAKHPQLAYLDTELARRLNSAAMRVLNSRHPSSAQTVIIAPDGLGLFPGSTNAAKDVWGDYGGGGTSPAPVEARTVLASLLPGVPLPDPLSYNQSTAALFEGFHDPYLPPTARLRVSVLLQLISVHQIAVASGITDGQAIQTFNLQPVLDIVQQGQHAP